MKEAIIKKEGGDITVSLLCEIDHHSAKTVREAIDREIAAGGFSRLILDFSGVSFMDSSGIGLILGRAERAAEAGASVAVEGASRTILRLLRMSGIEKHKSIKILEPRLVKAASRSGRDG